MVVVVVLDALEIIVTGRNETEGNVELGRVESGMVDCWRRHDTIRHDATRHSTAWYGMTSYDPDESVQFHSISSHSIPALSKSTPFRPSKLIQTDLCGTSKPEPRELNPSGMDNELTPNLYRHVL